MFCFYFVFLFFVVVIRMFSVKQIVKTEVRNVSFIKYKLNMKINCSKISIILKIFSVFIH